MNPRRLPGRGRIVPAGISDWSAPLLGAVAALLLAGCATDDPHPASPSTPGDPDHPPAASVQDREPAAPIQSDVVNRPEDLQINPYVPDNEPSK